MKIGEETFTYCEAFKELQRLADAGAGLCRLVQGQVLVIPLAPEDFHKSLRAILSMIARVATQTLTDRVEWACERCGRTNSVEVAPLENAGDALLADHLRLSPKCAAVPSETRVIFSVT